MNNILIIGDVQSKIKSPYWEGTQKLFDYLISKYSDYIFVSTGDWYEYNSPNNIVVDTMTKYLLKFKEAHIVKGNHDWSKIKDSALLHLNNHETIFTYNELTEKVIENLKFLFIPFSDKKEDNILYDKIEGNYDIVIPHLVPNCESFGGIYWNVKLNTNIGIFWGHIHLPKDYVENNNKNYIVGVPQPTKNGEQNFEPRIFLIENGKVREEKLPIFMTIKTIKYNEEIKENEHLYNVTEAPDIQAVYDKYRTCHIRRDGIELLVKDGDFQQETFTLGSISDKFLKFSEEQGISKEVVKCYSDYQNKLI